MVALYVTSLASGSGKTTVCAGLGKHLLNDSKKIGFFKPLLTESQNLPAEAVDSDAAFIKHLFTLEEPVDLLCPVFKDESNLRGNIKEAYAKVSPDKDVVIIEGISKSRQASHDVVAALNARLIIVEGYSKESLRAIDSYQDFGHHLLGVVLNKVPRRRLEQVRDEASTRFSQAGINLLGVLPEDRTLLALTIGELIELIQGETLNDGEKSTELVENFMLGAMSVDSGPDYFGRKVNKVVILRSERSDMQLAALQTPVRCLVLCGNTPPHSAALFLAEEKGIPVILAKDNIATMVTKIEDTLGKTRFNQGKKLPRLTQIMAEHFDFAAVYKGLDLSA